MILKNSRGFKIGEILEIGNILIVKDASGFKKGEYDPRTNITKDVLGRVVGTGNLLTTLL